MTPEELSKAFGDLVGSNQAYGLMILIVANFILGVLNALKDGKFTLAELGAILRKVAPYFGSFLALGVTGKAAGGTLEPLLLWAGTLLAGAPFASGTLRGAAELAHAKFPDVAERVLGMVPADKPFPKLEEYVAKVNELSTAYRTGTLPADAAAGRYLDLRAMYHDYPDLFPPGWPK